MYVLQWAYLSQERPNLCELFVGCYVLVSYGVGVRNRMSKEQLVFLKVKKK